MAGWSCFDDAQNEAMERAQQVLKQIGVSPAERAGVLATLYAAELAYVTAKRAEKETV